MTNLEGLLQAKFQQTIRRYKAAQITRDKSATGRRRSSFRSLFHVVNHPLHPSTVAVNVYGSAFRKSVFDQDRFKLICKIDSVGAEQVPVGIVIECPLENKLVKSLGDNLTGLKDYLMSMVQEAFICNIRGLTGKLYSATDLSKREQDFLDLFLKVNPEYKEIYCRGACESFAVKLFDSVPFNSSASEVIVDFHSLDPSVRDSLLRFLALNRNLQKGIWDHNLLELTDLLAKNELAIRLIQEEGGMKGKIEVQISSDTLRYDYALTANGV